MIDLKKLKEEITVMFENMTTEELTEWIQYDRMRKAFQPSAVFPTLEELIQTDWYRERPEIIKQIVHKLPPTRFYKFKTNGKQCYIYSYEEPKSGKLEDVTCTVVKTGVGGPMATMGLGELDTHRVFGVRFEDLTPWEE